MTQAKELDLGPLTWVKSEIDLALARAAESLEAAAQAEDGPARVQFAQTHLHQVRGALSIVGLDGLTQFATSVDQFLGAMTQGEITATPAHLELGRRALATISNYLEELSHGSSDQPLRLFPLYREIALAHGKDAPSPADLFFPDMGVRSPRPSTDPQTLPADIRQERVRSARARFQRGLLEWMKQPDSPSGIGHITEALRTLESVEISPPLRALWWAGQALADTLSQQGSQGLTTGRRLLSQLEALLRRLVNGPQAVPERLLRELLYHVAAAPQRTPLQQAVTQAWSLTDLLPEAGSRVSELPLAPLLQDLRSRLAQIKLDWDDFSNGTAAALPRFEQQVDEFATVANRLGHPAFDRLVCGIRDFSHWLRKDPLQLRETLAIELATALLLAETSLERGSPDSSFAVQVNDTLARLDALQRGETPASPDQSPGLEAARRAQEKEALSQLAREILSSLANIEQALDDFFRDEQKRAPLAQLSAPLHQIEGALTLLGETDAITVVHEAEALIGRYAAGENPSDASEFESLAHRLSALGFFIQSLQHSRVPLSNFLYPEQRGHAEAAPLAEITTAPADSFEAAAPQETVTENLAPEIDAVIDESSPPIAATELTAEATSEVAEPAPAAQPVPTAPPPPVSNEEIDAELLCIFIEEAHEVLGTVGEQLELSRTEPANREYLTAIRRGFHTLKGSGRMVGLRDFGEAAWGLEQTLNRWLQLEWYATPALHHLIDDAHQQFSDWVQQLEHGGPQARDVATLLAEADRLRSGDAPVQVPATISRTPEPERGDESIEPMDEGVVTVLGFDDLTLSDSGEILPFMAQPSGEPDFLPEETSLDEPALFAETDDLEAEALNPADVVTSLDLSELLTADETGTLPPSGTDEPSLPSSSNEAETEADLAPINLGPLLDSIDFDLSSEEDLESAVDEHLVEPVEIADSGIEASPTGWVEGADEYTPELPDLESFEGLDVDEAPIVPSGAELPVLSGPEDTDLALPPAADAHADAQMEAQDDIWELADETVALDDSTAIPVPDKSEQEISAPYPEPGVADHAEPLTATPIDSTPIEALVEATIEEPGALETFTDGIIDGVPPTLGATTAEETVAETDTVLEPDVADTTRSETDSLPSPASGDFVTIGMVEVSRPLYDLYMVEARHHIATLHQDLRRLTTNPTLQLPETSLRAAHTFAGISGTSRLAPLQNLARALEQAIQRLRDQGQSPATEELALFGSSVDALEAMLAEVGNRSMPLPTPELVEQLDAVGRAHLEPLAATDAPTIPSPAVASTQEVEETHGSLRINDEIDEQLLPIFLDEAGELISDLHASLRSWQTEPTTEQSKSVARLLHTLKGSARMTGAMTLGEHIHQLESRLEAALRTDQDIPALIDELTGGLDLTEQMIDALAGSGAIPGQPLEQAETAGPTDDTVPTEGESGTAAGTLRVRAELVDRFVNEAGEIGVARTRIEGELRNLRRSMLDLTENVIRLRNQLREVELQADVQMQSRIAQAESHHTSFDPLEMDRYTRLQELTRMMAESVNDVTTVQQSLLKNLDGADLAIHSQARLSRELQQALMRVRMVPFDSLADRLYRIVRKGAKELGKRANLDLRGGRIEVDRSMLEHMVAPLEHLLRNSLAHGIEAPAERKAAGKPEIGQITLTVRQEGNEISLELADDGAGLNFERIAARARENGLLGADEASDERRLTNLIFVPGFSTAGALSAVSGRGVGMDVVKSETAAVGGRIDVGSTPGNGTVFRIYLPLTLAVTQALLIRAGGRHYAIPSSMVAQVMELKADALEQLRRDGGTEWLGQHYAYRYLPRLLGDRNSQPEIQRYNWVLLLRAGAQTLALHVDALRGNQEIIVKNAGPQLTRIVGMSGATVLGDGEIVLILNPVALASRSLAAHEVDTMEAGGVAASAVEDKLAHLPVVMVVDDSLTVRKITSRLLEREGYRVITAKDGVDALEALVETTPDVILSDIEMPRMDGFDLVRNIRADARTRDIPVIMITSRLADKHRSYAMEIGANHYLGKPYQEEELLALIGGYTGRT
ncbi:response regulator [Azoarcus communis]|uniref:Hpt domain-containing protein n=1 Tax=Parazoarcus communis TaxID=41977 RepID=UPI001459426C|nr:Hpt domain-containing protein [Parazoarcus communis]NMG50197.1 response regulator [Parazoarcus communis]